MGRLHLFNSVDLASALETRGLFDANWYQLTHNVDTNAVSAIDHYVKYGRFVGYKPNSSFDPEFYKETYLTGRDFIPEIDHFISVNDGRPTCEADIPAAFRQRVQALAGGYSTDFQKIVSYCIPIKNRLGDIQATLRENLDTNRAYSDKIEFIIGIFDEDDEAENWLLSNFEDELKSGYLRYFRSDILDVWHFPRAKNSFRPHLIGAVHSSLDGDNFVTAEETQLAIDMWTQYGDRFLLHSFSGDHGDGSCGRITTSTNVYRAVGYDETLLTFQYDDISCVLRTLHAFPWIGFFTFAGDRNILTEKQNVVLGKHANLDNRVIQLERPNWKAPANPKGLASIASNQKYRALNHVNSLITWQKLIPDEVFHIYFDNYINENLDWLAAISKRKELFGQSFDTRHPSFIDSEPSDEPTAILCVKDQAHILLRQISHLRAIGIERFLIIDDHSATPLESYDFGPNTHFFVPRSGSFRSTKKLWIETLAKAFVQPGTWLLVTDADEFVELKPEHKTIQDLIASLPKDQTYVPGLMVDVVTGSNFNPGDADPSDLSTFDLHYCENTDQPTEDYRDYYGIKWAFKKYPQVSWTFDIRHHMVQTYDCLRKVPLFIYDHSTHIHEGFHTVYDNCSASKVDSEWLHGGFVFLRHEKLIQYEMELDPNVARLDTTINAPDRLNRERLRNRLSQSKAVGPWLKPYSVGSVYEDITKAIERGH